MRFLPNESLFLCIDVQERLYPHINSHERVLEGCMRMLQAASILEVPVVLSEQYPKGLGHTLAELRAALPRVEPLIKSCFSCVDDDAIHTRIKELGLTSVIVFGIETHVCVLQTVFDLLRAGFRVCVVSDAVGSRFDTDKVVALQAMQQAGARISTSESIIFELCRDSASPLFKSISALVKNRTY